MTSGGEIHRVTLPIINARGLHARAASKFCQLASQFDAVVTVTRGPHTVSACEVMEVLLLGAIKGTEVEIVAEGTAAADAIAALSALVEDRFGEPV